jgi:lysophospholipase L1-like esterase
MTEYSRRAFLKTIAALAGLSLTARSQFSQPPAVVKPFEFLVVGDSIISGQGLAENQRSYYLVKQWLETEVFENLRKVELKVKAHSGASINLRPNETAALKKAGVDENKPYPGEVNLTFPSITSQVDTTIKEYADPRTVDLVMLTGGITDTRLTRILDPFRSNEELRREIVKHCGEDMFGLLGRIAAGFPNALIVLIGYYPVISKYTPEKKLLNHVLEVSNFPGPFKSLVNNPLNRVLFKHYTNKMIARSMLWAKNSTFEFKKTVARLNAELGAERAVFVDSPIREENSLGAPKTLVFELGKNGKPQDPTAAERKAICREVLPALRESIDLKFGTRICEMAGIGHPDQAGAKAIAEAIQNDLKKFFTKMPALPLSSVNSF